MNEITHKILNRISVVKALLLSAGALALNANAAVVTVTTPGGTDGSPYMVPMDSEVYNVYQNIESGAGLGSVAGNGGEEFILLGAHETILHPSDGAFNGCTAAGTCNEVIDVNLTNDSGSSATGAISLLLSASEALVWNLNYDVSAGIDIRSIYIFGADVDGQSLQINGVDVVINNVLQMGASSINVDVSDTSVCAFSYPANESGCDTEALLGLGLFDNFLAEETSLEVTNFNGSEYVDQFDVSITNAAPVPLPGALLLFSSILGAAFGFKQKFK